MSDFRLGDVIDDFCVKCRRITNHSIVSILNGDAAKVRCRTCYNDHDFRHEQAPPSKKDLKKMELFKEVLATVDPEAAVSGVPELTPANIAPGDIAPLPPEPAAEVKAPSGDGASSRKVKAKAKAKKA